MIPGEIMPADGDITLNEDAEQISITVANTGDGRFRLAVTIILQKPIRRWNLTAMRRAACALISPPARLSGLNRASAAR